MHMAPVLVPRVPAPTRADNVLKAVQDALAGYRAVVDADIHLRSVQIDIKLDKDGRTVRAVLISTQGEISKR